MREVLRVHWPEYLMETWGLGTFDLGRSLRHLDRISGVPSAADYRRPRYSSCPDRAGDGTHRNRHHLFAVGPALGGAYQSFGHPLTFLRLGKVAPWEAAFYIIAQFIGGTLGVLGMALVLDSTFTDPPVAYVATVPGPAGVWVAFVAELLISMGLMLMVLFVSNTERIARFTGLCAGCLVALYITVEAPFSGMSMNPARTFASAAAGGPWTLEKFLKPMGITQYWLAKDINVPQRRISEIVQGKRSITADTALRLGRFFGTEAQFWLNL